MVYQIYYGDKRPREVLFDIEYFIKESDGSKNEGVVELHSLSFISGAVHFICNELKPELREEFIKDCDENIRSNDEVLIVNEEGELLAFGKALLNHKEMMDFKTGQAIKTRKGFKK